MKQLKSMCAVMAGRTVIWKRSVLLRPLDYVSVDQKIQLASNYLQFQLDNVAKRLYRTVHVGQVLMTQD